MITLIDVESLAMFALEVIEKKLAFVDTLLDWELKTAYSIEQC